MIISRSINYGLLLLAIISDSVIGSEKEKKGKRLKRVPSLSKKHEVKKTEGTMKKGELKKSSKQTPKVRGVRVQATSSDSSLQSKSQERRPQIQKRQSEVSPRRQAVENAMTEKMAEKEKVVVDTPGMKPRVSFQKSSTIINTKKLTGPSRKELELSRSQLDGQDCQVVPLLVSPQVTPKDLMPVKRPGIVAFNRVYKSAMQRRNVSLRKDLDTPSRTSVGMSRKLAVWFRIYDSQVYASDANLGYHFRPGTVKMTLRYAKTSRTINIDEILIIKDLGDDEIVLSKKIGLVGPAQVNVILTYTSETPRNPNILKNLQVVYSSPDLLYYQLRQILKTCLHDHNYTFESFKDVLSNSECWKRLPSYYIADLAMDLCIGIDKLLEGPVVGPEDAKLVLLMKWDVYRAFKGYRTGIKPALFIKSQFDLQDLFDEILSLESASQLRDILVDNQIWSLHINLEITRRMVRHLHRCRYLKSFTILSLALERFETSFTKAILKDDILFFMERVKSFDRVSFPVIRTMLSLLSTKWPDDNDHIWLSNYIENATHLPIEVHEAVGDWTGAGEFTMLIRMLWSAMPKYFVCDPRSNLFKLSHKRNPKISMHDVFLEFAPVLKLLDVAASTNPNEVVINRNWFQQATAKFINQMNLSNVGNGFGAFCYALDFYLHVSGFVENLIAMEFEEKVTGQISKEKYFYHNVAAELGRQLLLVHLKYVALLKNAQDIPVLLKFLANRKLRRCVFLVNWTSYPRIVHNVGGITQIAKEDLLSFVYLVLGQGWQYKDIETMAGMLMKSFEDAKIEGGVALLQVLAGIGDPMRTYRSSPKINSSSGSSLTLSRSSSLNSPPSKLPRFPEIWTWEAPRSLWDLEDPDQSIPVLRAFLALKFGINFATTRSNICEMMRDRWAPFEFEAFVNFFLERHCGILGKEPAFKIRIHGDLFRWLKEHPEEEPCI